ncbi:hypothetical protein CFIICLFH_3551 [Methylobacterium goesingense]|nr:hypothetical protein CFIICLFH_3551 [Methylobacterium goesingense]
MPEREDDRHRRQGLADEDDAQHRQHRERLADQDAGVEQHADGDEEQHREGVLQGQGIGRRLMAEVGFGQHHAGEEGAEREGDAEEFRRAEGDAEGQRQHRQGEELPRARARRLIEEPGHEPAPAHQHHGGEDADLGQRQAEGEPDVAVPGMVRGARAVAAERGGQRRQQHQGQHHRQVLDDEPTHRDAALVAVEEPALLQSPQQHHGARHRQGEAEDEARPEAPAPDQRQGTAHGGGRHDLHDRTGQRDGAYRHQVLDREVQADAEHQQDDADLGELARELAVADEARRVGADEDAREEVADEGRQAQALRQHSADEGEHEAEGDDGDQLCRVRHGSVVSGSRERAPRAVPRAARGSKPRSALTSTMGPKIRPARRFGCRDAQRRPSVRGFAE